MTSPFLVSAILFDLDGTLVNSNSVVERVWTQWALRHGVSPAALLAVSHGRPARDTMREFRPDLAEAEIEAMSAAHIQEEEGLTDGIVAVPGAADLLASLPADRWAIVTSCPPKLAQVRREAAGLPAPCLSVHGNDVKHGKPAPDIYLLAATKMGLDPAACLVVEDAPAGVRAGRSAGMKVLALRTTVPDNPEANLVLNDLTGVRVTQVESGELLVEVL